MSVIKNVGFLQAVRETEWLMNDFIQSPDAIKFIWHVIQTYTKSPKKYMETNQIDEDDLIQAGRVGLYKGIINADLSLTPNEIQRYIYLRIQGEIGEFRRKNANGVVIYQRIREMSSKYKKFKGENEEHSIEDVMNHFSISKEDAEELMYGLDSVVDEITTNPKGKQYSVFETTPSIENVEKFVINKILVENALSILNQKEKYIMEQHYACGYTKSEIARQMGVTPAMIIYHLKSSKEKFKQTITK